MRLARAAGCGLALLVLAASAATPAAEPAVAECVVLRAPDAGSPFVSDASECARATSPASTFKVPHALLALQTGVVTTATVFPWDGSPRPFAAWQRDHTIESAIQWSVLPFFQHTARLIGLERMRRGLAGLGYGDDEFGGAVDQFWLNGELVITPLAQVDFLQRFFAGRLDVPALHVDSVRRALRMPAGQVLLGAGPHPFRLEWPSDTVVYAKTGNTTVNGERVSWLVGALERQGRAHVFAARARSSGALANTAGADLAARVLNARRPAAPGGR